MKAKVIVGGGIFGVQTGTLKNEIDSNRIRAYWEVPNVSNFLTSPYVKEWDIEMPLGAYEPPGTAQVSYKAQYLGGPWLPTPSVNVAIGTFSQPAPSAVAIVRRGNVAHISWNPSNGNTMYRGSTGYVVPPPAPPANPPEELETYRFVAGLKPSLQWQPLTVGAAFELKVPTLEPFEPPWETSLNIPKEPISPDIPPVEFSFHTTNATLGNLLGGIAPIEWNAITAEGKIGIQGGITAEAGVRLAGSATSFCV